MSTPIQSKKILFGPENNRIFSISQSTKLWSRPETRASRYGEGAYTEKAKDIINFQETVARAAEKRSKLQVYCKCVESAFCRSAIVFIFDLFN